VLVRLDEWFLTAGERGNPATTIDTRHRDGCAWTVGNDLRPLVHGAVYFAELLRRVRAMRRGDLLLFTDWRGDPDERLDGPGTEVARVFCAAARRDRQRPPLAVTPRPVPVQRDREPEAGRGHRRRGR